MPDDTCLNEHDQHTERATNASAMFQSEEVTDLLESEEEDLSTSTRQDLVDQPPEPPPTKKQKTSLVSTYF